LAFQVKASNQSLVVGIPKHHLKELLHLNKVVFIMFTEWTRLVSFSSIGFGF